MLRGLNIFMAILFLLSVVVQVNDPDALLWILIYSYGLVVTVMAASGRYTYFAVIGAVSYLAGCLYLSPAFLTLESPAKLVTDIKMDYEGVEEAREAGGLLIGACWMAVLSVVWYRRRNGESPPVEQPEEESL